MIACQAQRKAGSATHFIDRNPDRFSKVLDYLRDGKLLADKDCNFEKLRLEADFYGLDDLVRIVDETKAQDELRNRTKHVVVTSKDNNSYSGRWIEIAVNPREDDHFLLRHLQQRYPCRVRAPSFQFPYDFTFELRACSTCATCASGPYDYHCQRNPGYRQHGVVATLESGGYVMDHRNVDATFTAARGPGSRPKWALPTSWTFIKRER
ncbi:BTB/POZ domain-containing protein KCTD17 [Aphelenchoides avenae]|nr:BTB/POZ domain-containing protein KCTD17 [Aphelenchus avenae]